MPTQDYTKRELDSKFNNLQTSVDTMSQNQTIAHTAMLDQLKVTNGRVKSLELWKAGVLGALSIISMMVVPILIWMVRNWIT